MTYEIFIVIVQGNPSGDTQTFSYTNEAKARLAYKEFQHDNEVELIVVKRGGRSQGLVYLHRNFTA